MRLHPGLRLLLILAVGLLGPTGTARAHKASDAYLAIAVDGAALDVHWDIALRDLDAELGLDADGNAEITWGELSAQRPAIVAYALPRLGLRAAGQACRAGPVALAVDTHTDGSYAVLGFRADCTTAPAALDIDYRLFATTDPGHRGLLKLSRGSHTHSAVFSPAAASQHFTLAATGHAALVRTYLVEGVTHILVGYDHILFLLSLLLPAVAWREAGRWRAETSLRVAVIDVARVVTAFTVAHSLTLSAAALGWLALPSRLVESTIALSVAVAAVANLTGVGRRRRWQFALLFGLVHGFGFAAVLGDLGLPAGALTLALVAFNLGVEVGQLAIVVAFMPLAYALRGSAFYRRGCYMAGSWAITAIALVWFVERAWGVGILS